MLEEEDMKKISRRVDGLIYREKSLEIAKLEWFEDYNIPTYLLDQFDNKKESFDFSQIENFMLEVAEKTEFSSETYVAKFEDALPEKEKRSFLGLIQWEI